MRTIGITGASGFIGWHLRAFLSCQKAVNQILVDENDFVDQRLLIEKVDQCSVIVHLAGMNRGDERKIYITNVGLTKKLIEACETAKVKPHIIFISSVHRNRKTAYGRSKKKSEKLLRTWAKKNKTIVTNLILPNVFGEYGRPFYNSAVATFCYQLARGEQPKIISDSTIKLVYVQKVAEIIFSFIKKPRHIDFKVSGESFKISNLLLILLKLKNDYFNNIIPSFRKPIERNLFNTLRSYFFETPNFFPKIFELKNDARGSLFEMLKHHSAGQFFASTTKPGAVRGNHYHTRKFERFAVIQGKAEIALRRILTDKVIRFKVNGNQPVFVDMPTFYTHNIKNIGRKNLLTLFWSDEIFNPADADTYQEKV